MTFKLSILPNYVGHSKVLLPCYMLTSFITRDQDNSSTINISLYKYDILHTNIINVIPPLFENFYKYVSLLNVEELELFPYPLVK